MVALGSTAIDTAKFGSLDVTSLYLGSNEAWTAGEPAELIKPTSIANSGGTASIGTNGQVTFSGVTSLSLNEVFTADFDNYVVVSSGTHSSTSDPMRFNLRAAGSDATGGNYTRQILDVNGTSVGAARQTAQTFLALGTLSNSQRAGNQTFIYGPYLAQPTAFRNVNVDGYLNATIFEGAAGTHSLSTSYDGFTISPSGGSFTGKLAVYGIRM